MTIGAVLLIVQRGPTGKRLFDAAHPALVFRRANWTHVSVGDHEQSPFELAGGLGLLLHRNSIFFVLRFQRGMVNPEGFKKNFRILTRSRKRGIALLPGIIPRLRIRVVISGAIIRRRYFLFFFAIP